MSGEYFHLGDPVAGPGIHLVHCDSPIKVLDWAPTSGPAYIGKAETGLRNRTGRVHCAVPAGRASSAPTSSGK